MFVESEALFVVVLRAVDLAPPTPKLAEDASRTATGPAAPKKRPIPPLRGKGGFERSKSAWRGDEEAVRVGLAGCAWDQPCASWVLGLQLKIALGIMIQRGMWPLRERPFPPVEEIIAVGLFSWA